MEVEGSWVSCASFVDVIFVGDKYSRPHYLSSSPKIKAAELVLVSGGTFAEDPRPLAQVRDSLGTASGRKICTCFCARIRMEPLDHQRCSAEARMLWF